MRRLDRDSINESSKKTVAGPTEMSTAKTQSSNEKAARLIEYLSRITTLRTQSVRDVTYYQSTLWISNIPHEQTCYTLAWGCDEEYNSDDWIEVRNRQEPILPAVPAQCKDWIDYNTLRNSDSSPKLLSEITRQISNQNLGTFDQRETISQIERIEDHPEVQHAWDRYVAEKWFHWMEEYKAWGKLQKVYSMLFSMHQDQIRLGEEYELVLGLGLLTWLTPSGQHVRRHLIVADALLEFEARLGKFTVRPSTEGAKLRIELDMLDIEEQPMRAEEIATRYLPEAKDDPWKKATIDGVLQALVHSLNPQSYYDDSLEKKELSFDSKPVVQYSPALILRKRSAKGYTEALRKIKEQILNGMAIPDEFADLAEIRSVNDRKNDVTHDATNVENDGEIFFPKPSNDEQRRIVDQIRSGNGVLVQGPPGTGKSHTIANLICHLLATGKRTLITAKSPRALQVLKGLIPSELHPLCINLLGSGVEERRSLESSVDGILSKSEEWKEKSATQEREELTKYLRKSREEKAKVDRRLRDIREAETFPQSIAEGTYKGTAAQIAKKVNLLRATYEWFQDVVPLDENCRISTTELQNTLHLLRNFSPEKRAELALECPEITMPTQYFAKLINNEASAIEEQETSKDGADQGLADLFAENELEDIKSIHDVLSDFCNIKKRLTVNPHAWMTDALRDILGGNSSLWNILLKSTRDAITSVEEHIILADDTRIEFPDTCDLKVLWSDTIKLKEHMENGGKLGWSILRPKTVKERLYVLKTVKVDGSLCSTPEHFATLANVLHVRIEFEKIWNFWGGRLKVQEGPYALQLTVLKSLSDALETAVSLEKVIEGSCEALRKCQKVGIPIWSDEFQVKKIIQSCHLALAMKRKQDATKAIHCLEVSVSNIIARGNTHPVMGEMLDVIRNRDIERFAQVTNTIQALVKDRSLLQTEQDFLMKIRKMLPRFVDCLEHTCNQTYWEERIEEIGNAWRWSQARSWIEDYIRQEDAPALAKRSKQIEDEINKIIEKLASLHAWSFCCSRLKETHRRHMQSWKLSIRRLGLGKGKHAARHRGEAQEHLNECREAVPVWIMPLHRVWDTVSPAPGMFDMIIIDEASQCGIESLPLLYLSKKILIVGDDKQISPEAVGYERGRVHYLMDELLFDFQFKSSFHLESSLFDQGQLRYGTRRITLREHFRCMPEIIRFSSNLCYSDTPLIPLRQYRPNRLPPLDHVFVSGGYREGSNNRVFNRPEADSIVDKIVKLCHDSRYDNMSIGVVVLQGDAQATLIEELLLDRLGAEEMDRRRLLCGNPYIFQGDERDIIILSLVAGSNSRTVALTKAADERRFNVAASRARDLMILFHSVTCDDLSANCLRRKLIEYFENPEPQQIAGIDITELELRATQDNRSILRPPSPFDSWFEVDVALELLRRNYVIHSQYKVAQKRIDLVVEGEGARLAVECDGDHWHGADQYEEDMQRQRQLERCGWEFFRVRESAFYINKNDALAGLWQALKDRDILPKTKHKDKLLDKTNSTACNEEPVCRNEGYLF